MEKSVIVTGTVDIYYSESEKVKQKLEKLGAVVLKKVIGNITRDNRLYVIYNQKGKTKLAVFNLCGYYYDRYGPNVIATFNGKRFWFQSNDIANSLTEDELLEMKKSFIGESELAKFDPEILGNLFH
jgi:hypothetical protein